MPKILLRSNRRFGTLGISLAVILATVCCVVAASTSNPWLFAAASALATLGAVVALQAGLFLATPRVAIDERELLLYVRSLRKPFRVPLDVVEVFFIGQGAVSGTEPGQPREYEGAVAANVIVRLAESAPEWHLRTVNPWLAVWSDGYVTIRGLWCENIDQELLKAMNGTLIAAKRNRRNMKEERTEI